MELRWRPEEQDFRAEVEAFVARHRGADAAGWRRALGEQGWTVPCWPVSAGGCGWRATQALIWRRAVAAEAELAALLQEFEFGIDALGPWLLAHADQVPKARDWLDGIRSLAAVWHWVDAAAVPGVRGDAKLRMARAAGGWRLHGEASFLTAAPPLRDAGVGQRVLLLTTEPLALAAIDPMAGGADAALTAGATLDGRVRQTLSFDGARPDDLVLLDPTAGPALAAVRDALATPAMPLFETSAFVSDQLALIEGHLDEFEDGDGIHVRAAELGVARAALAAMELRYVDAQERGVATPIRHEHLRQRGQAILLQLGELQVECFGYYALPHPDPRLTHNEDPVGPEGIAAARRGLARMQARLFREPALEAELEVKTVEPTKQEQDS